MLSGVQKTFDRQKWLLLVIGIIYVLPIAAGIATAKLGPKSLLAHIETSNKDGLEHVEKIFGMFQQPVRDGDLRTMALCSGLVFVLNLF